MVKVENATVGNMSAASSMPFSGRTEITSIVYQKSTVNVNFNVSSFKHAIF